MLSKDCSKCQFCQWLKGIGQGVRCTHEENQKYKEQESNLNSVGRATAVELTQFPPLSRNS